MNKQWTVTIVIVVLAGLVAYFLMPKGAEAPSDNNQIDTMSENTYDADYFRDKTVTLKTSAGDIVLKFYYEDAPKAVENFVRLAEDGYYDGIIFHRVIGGFMIQGGDPTGTGRGGESVYGRSFTDELNPDSSVYQRGYKRGVLAMANRGPNTNGSQFFIMLADAPNLPKLYTIFGEVVSGQEVVDTIGKLAVDSDDKPLDPPVIQKAIVK